MAFQRLRFGDELGHKTIHEAVLIDGGARRGGILNSDFHDFVEQGAVEGHCGVLSAKGGWMGAGASATGLHITTYPIYRFSSCAKISPVLAYHAG
jgi:hypothetical protein